jgi:hypothetical protein
MLTPRSQTPPSLLSHAPIRSCTPLSQTPDVSPNAVDLGVSRWSPLDLAWWSHLRDLRVLAVLPVTRSPIMLRHTIVSGPTSLRL